MRRFLFLAFALIVLNTVGLLYIAHRNAPIAGREVVANLRVVAFAPSGLADDADRLTVLFDEPVVTPDQVGTRPSATPFEIKPTTPGRWEWTGVKELTYLLDEPLAPGQDYHVAPASNHVSALGRNLVGETEFDFATRRLMVEDCTLLSQDDTHATFKLAFNQPVAPGELLDHLQVLATAGGAPLEVRSLVDEPDAELVLRVSRARGAGVGRDESLHLLIKPGLAGDGGVRGLTSAWEQRIALDPVFAFARLRVPMPGLSEATSLRVQFSRALDRGQGAADVVVTPAVEQLRTGYSGSDLYITGVFEPGRRYTVEVGGGLRAANGDALGEAVKLTADIPDRRASLSLPVSRGYLMPGGNLLLDLKAVNVSGVEVTTWRVHDNNLVSHLRGDRVDASSRATGGRFVPVELERNTVGSFALDLREVLADGGEVPPGIYRVQAHNAESRWVRDTTVVAVTDLALTAKRERDGYLVWVTSLGSSQPVAGVTVAGVSYNNQTLASAKTDADGLARLAIPPGHPDGEAWVITAQLGSDRSFLMPERRPVMIDTVDQAGRQYADHYEALLYTERGAYRPGDTVHLTGIVRTAHGQIPPDMPLTLQVTRPDGRVIAELPVELSHRQQGMFHADWPSDLESQLGAYRFEVGTPGGKAIGRVDALVESFEPVRIAMQAGVGSPYVARDEPMGVQVSARYLFGQPAAGLAVTASPRFVRRSFRSQLHPEMRFDDANAGDVVTGRAIAGALDGDGEASLVISGDRLGPHRRGWWEARVGVTVTEEGGRSVSRSVSAVVDTAGRYIGLRGPGAGAGGYASIHSPQTYRWVCVTGEDVLAQPGESVFVLSRVVRDVLLEEVNGEMVWRTTQTLEEVARWTFDGQAEGELAVTFDRPGLYELRAIDRQANSTTQLRIYAADSAAQYEALAADRPERIELALDRSAYAPGDAAVLQLRSAFKSGGTALVTIETDRVIHQQVVTMTQGAASVTLPVDASIRGGAFVSVSMVRAVDPGDPDWLPHRAVGLVRLMTTHETQRIEASFDAVEHALPGETVTVTLQTNALREPGAFQEVEPAAGIPDLSTLDGTEVVEVFRPAAVAHLWAVDEGILLTTGHATPDAHGFFFALRRGSVRTTDLFADLLPDHERGAGIARIGGDGGDLEAMRRSPVSRPRHDPAVVWRASVPVEPDGTVRAAMTMPELNGEMRLMAVIVDGDRYGSAERALTLSSPVMVEASWPRFAAPGDRFEVPVKVFNNTDEAVSAYLRVEVDGPLEVDPASLAQPVLVEPGSAATRWLSVTAGHPGPVELRVIAEAPGAGGGEAQVSQQRTTLSVRAAGALQTRSQVVRVAPGETLELAPLAGMVAGTAHLQLRIGGGPSVDLMPAADQLLTYPYGCAEQTVGGLVALLSLPELIDGRATADGGVAPTRRAEHVRAVIEAGLHRLWGMQTRSGGIAYWPGHLEPSVWVSAYVGAFVLDAESAGYAVDGRFREPLMDYLEDQLNRRRGSSELDDNTRALICRVLTRAGRPQHGWAGALETGVDRLDIAGRAHLAACLLELGRRDRALALLDADLLSRRINPTTEGRLTSQAQQESVLLAVLLELDPEHAWVPLLAERLEAHRAQGHWGTTLNNAAAIQALVEYQRKLGPPAPFTGSVQLGDGPSIAFDHTRPTMLDVHRASGGLRVETDGPGSAAMALVVEGLVEPDAIVEADHNLVVRRRWLDREGNAVDPLGLAVGDLVYVELTVRTAEGAAQRHVNNIAIVDALPGGMEVENPRLATSAQGEGFAASATLYRRTQFLDDRVLLFVSAGPGETMYRYALRVVTPGSFALPPVQASCMYDASVSSVHGAGRVEVGR